MDRLRSANLTIERTTQRNIVLVHMISDTRLSVCLISSAAGIRGEFGIRPPDEGARWGYRWPVARRDPSLLWRRGSCWPASSMGRRHAIPCYWL